MASSWRSPIRTDPVADDPPFRRVAVVGLGVMGGSLARALSSIPAGPEVAGWSPAEGERAAARAEGAVGHAPPRVEEALDGADLVVYAAPLEATLALMRAHARLLDEGTVATDVCSLKAPLAAVARDSAIGDRFVGGHPMAGTHRSGFASSSRDLYRGSRVWLVAEESAHAALRRVEALWRSVGAEPRVTSADAHDRLMAWASHLPQVASWALAAALREQGATADDLGPGGRDSTRLAASPLELWLELLRWNREADVAALDAFVGNIASLRDALAAGDEDALRALLSDARAWKTAP